MTTNLTALYGLGGTSGGCKWKSKIFTASGLWQKPEGVETAKVLLVGGGSAGGNGTGGSGAGNDGGNSQFGSLLIAYGARGITGGGIGTGITTIIQRAGDMTIPYYELISATNPGTQNYNYSSMIGMNGISSLFGSSGAGGGGSLTNQGAGPGGRIIGMGVGGIAYYGGGGGGGGSFGNGGNAAKLLSNYNAPPSELEFPAQDGVFGGGGGGSVSYSRRNDKTYYGPGGGGGEVVFRDVPVSGDQVVIIGAGGQKGVSSAGSGGNGLCIVYWME